MIKIITVFAALCFSNIAYSDSYDGIKTMFQTMNQYGGIGALAQSAAIKAGDCKTFDDIKTANPDVRKWDIINGQKLENFLRAHPEYNYPGLTSLLIAYNDVVPLVNFAAFLSDANLSQVDCFLGWSRQPMEVEDFEAAING